VTLSDTTYKSSLFRVAWHLPDRHLTLSHGSHGIAQVAIHSQVASQGTKLVNDLNATIYSHYIIALFILPYAHQRS
jgi:hypothetical protein